MIYRYVLQLEGPEGTRSLHWTFVHPVNEHDVVNLAILGSWRVVRAASGSDGDAGFLYCEPARDY
jgi:hypothetical protein